MSPERRFFVKRATLLAGVAFAMAFMVPSVSAEVIQEVSRDGYMTLEDGKQVSLAGIRMDEEGASILRVLVRKKNAKVEVLETARDKNGRECAYVYLKAKFLKVPLRPNDVAGEDEVMLNKFLIRLGAAKVDESSEFAHKADFLETQVAAKSKGEGVWSYEVS
ncbi:MAG TPA: thermonuclease family protein [Candidatus Omnitrophota bacterium]|nr:thermonuclease family protein [Candidatus Omnitrophota bacterium]